MFQEYTLLKAMMATIVITFGSISGGVLYRNLHADYCSKHADSIEKKHRAYANYLKFIMLLCFSAAGLGLGNLINIGTNFIIAQSHGMTKNLETDEYDIPYGEVIYLNRNSIKETNIDPYALKNKAIIYVRYDCPDCVILHEQLAEIDDMIFLSSRTTTGKTARELYNINLTEIPQGVYINSDGEATVVKITQGSGDTLTLDLQQIAILREMANQ